MSLTINNPLVLSRRPEILGSHPDLKKGEKLIQMATNDETIEALAAMASGLKEYFGDDQPVCVPIKKGAMGTMQLLQKIDPEMFGNVRPITISTTDGQNRLPEPKVLGVPSPESIAGKRVLIVDGVADTLRTLLLAVDTIWELQRGTGLAAPVEVMACVAVLKDGADQFDVPALTDAAMLADKDDWVVGIGADGATGMDLDNRFRDLAVVWHIQIPK